jgi:hypothetical protein
VIGAVEITLLFNYWRDLTWQQSHTIGAAVIIIFTKNYKLNTTLTLS